MSSATQTKTERTMTDILKVRDTELLSLNISLEEFSKHVTVTCEQWRNSLHWRITGDEALYYWICDKHTALGDATLIEDEIIALAYEHLKTIQARKGQINIHSVYVQECEDVEFFPRKYTCYANVRIVRDRVDGLYRYSTAYFLNNGGGSSSPSMTSKTAVSRNYAILAGAARLIDTLTGKWEYRDGRAAYDPYINKIKAYVEALETEIRQPTLF